MIKKTLHTFLTREFLTFCIVGGISTIVNYAFFYLFYKFQVQYLIASALGYIAGVFAGYLLNRKYTFKSKSKKYATEMIKYFSVYTISLFLGLAFLEFQVSFGIHVLIANVFTIGLTTVTNFLGTKFAVFYK